MAYTLTAAKKAFKANIQGAAESLLESHKQVVQVVTELVEGDSAGDCSGINALLTIIVAEMPALASDFAKYMRLTVTGVTFHKEDGYKAGDDVEWADTANLKNPWHKPPVKVAGASDTSYDPEKAINKVLADLAKTSTGKLTLSNKLGKAEAAIYVAELKAAQLRIETAIRELRNPVAAPVRAKRAKTNPAPAKLKAA